MNSVLSNTQFIDYTPVRQSYTNTRRTALATLGNLFNQVREGSHDALYTLQKIQRGDIRLFESQTTSDFAALTSELMARELKAAFRSQPSTFRQYVPVRSTPVTDFRNVYSVGVDRDANSSTFGQIIPEGGTFGYSTFKDTLEGYRVFKYIEGYKSSFELRMQDDLGGLAQVVPYMVDDARYVQELFAVNLHCDASGPLASLYSTARGNIVIDSISTGTPVTNPELSLTSLQAAWAQLKSATDTSGRPIFINGAVLVVGSAALEIRAMEILNTIEIRRETATRLGAPSLPPYQVVFNPYIGQVVTTNLETSWWLFPAPATNPTRTWAEMGFMANYDTPQVFMKAPSIMTTGGQMVSDIGSFDTWSHEYAVATIFGGRNLVDYQVTVASDGTES